MNALSAALVLSVFILYVRERVKNRNLNREIAYIGDRLGSASYMQENGYILVASENTGIKELSAQINRLLEVFYAQKSDYKRSKRAMEQMLTNISHDLRTPLTVLKGYSELLVKEMEKSAAYYDRENMIRKIDQKADELVGTINEYFTMAKIESGDMGLEIQRMDITAVCHETILDYYDILEKQQFEVDIRIDDAPVHAYADAGALGRILKNLLDNAVRHGGGGRYLGFRLVHDAGRAVIEVEDHGVGIAEKEREQIFDRNYTTARKSAGSGLGLTIARRLAIQMDACISVSSKPGQGTTFTLVLKS